jgi:hypothetical protein
LAARRAVVLIARTAARERDSPLSSVVTGPPSDRLPPGER